MDICDAAGLLATGDVSGAIRLWDLNTGATLTNFTGHTGPVMSLRFSRRGRVLYSVSVDGSIRAVDLTHYRTHIAAHLLDRLNGLDLSAVPPAEIAAWRDWATETPPSDQPAPGALFLLP